MTSRDDQMTPKAPRDARIDLARGLTMLIIFVAHVPGNIWADFIPARMGFSSGAEAFVLCSGLACGLAFGGVYRRQGWLAGTRRIVRRIGQLWLAQSVAFGAFALMLLALDAWLDIDTYRMRYSLDYVRAQPFEAGFALATLRYVPDFFDILPLYIVVLAAVPVAVAMAGFSHGLTLGVSASLWLMVQVWPLNLPAHPVADRLWYFDPLAWQFLFFIGFGITAQWIRPPRSTPIRVALVAAMLALCVPLTFWFAHETWPILGELYRAIYPAEAISTLHPLRLLHVLLLGWLFAALLHSRRSSLFEGPLRPMLIVGQQSLITFIAGIFLSALAGVALDRLGRDHLATALVNLAGAAALVAISYAARHMKSTARARGQTNTETVPCPAAR